MKYLLSATLLLLCVACSSEDPLDPTDAHGSSDTSGEDTPSVDSAEVDTPGEPERPTGPVWIDLEPFVPANPDEQARVRAFVTTEAGQLVSGQGARGRVGDIVIENESARFLIQGDDRSMSPCPFGGNVIDGQIRGESPDVLGSVCLFLNAQQTVVPIEQVIIEDGSKGYAVVAVTGKAAMMDFIDIRAMLGTLLGPAIINRMELFTEGVLPVMVTTYYILRSEESGLHVVTALRNDGEERLDMLASHIIVTDGDGSFFNPLGRTKGFGHDSNVGAAIQGDPLSFLAYLAEHSSFAYVPSPAEHLSGDLPIAGTYTTIAGVTASLLGRRDFLQTLLASRTQLAAMDGILHLEAGDVEVLEYRLFVGDGSLSSMLGDVYEVLEVETGVIEGRVLDHLGAPLEGVHVVAVDSADRTMNHGRSDAAGRYRLDVPPDEYRLLARREGRVAAAPTALTLRAGERVEVDVNLAEEARLEVVVRTAQGAATPARITVLCEGECPTPPTSQERDVTFDSLPEGWAAVAWAGVEGEISLGLVPGAYRIVVSRGMEWSVWPPDAPDAGGFALTLEGGETSRVEAEIARVVDSSGAISGDFHVHAIGSMDSPVPQTERVLSFLAEGVDLLVSTDHDVITDYAPYIEELRAGDEIVSIVGTEITTSVLGHFNAFPVVKDAADRRGGALDWGAGGERVLTPAEVFAWARSHPGEQVVQINHPSFSFLTYSDVLRGLTFGDPTLMRIDVPEPDPVTGDTGLWSEDFTAMEVMNGHSMPSFWGTARWWLTMVGRGYTPTATAVTDTHRRYNNTLGGVPRTFVYVPQDHDTPGSFDTAILAGAVNRGRAFGTNGPFIRVLARNESGEEATLGDVLFTGGEPVEVELVIEHADWMRVDRLDVYMNVDDVVTLPGKFENSPLEPTFSQEIVWEEEELQTVATGTVEHRRYRKTLRVTLESEVDAYVVFILRGAEGSSMYPVIPGRSLEAFAFTNPLYLDADGGGYDKPHLAALAATPSTHVAAMRDGHEEELKEAEIEEALHQIQCRH